MGKSNKAMYFDGKKYVPVERKRVVSGRYTRVFNNKTYVLEAWFRYKLDADSRAKNLRASGWNARVINVGGYQPWALYKCKRAKQKRVKRRKK